MMDSELPEDFEDEFEEDQEDERFGMCMVLLRNPSIDFAVLASELRKEFGPQIEIDPEPDEDLNLACEIDGAELIFALVESPVPDQEAEYAAGGYFMWEDGPEEVAQHQAHVIVSCFASGQSDLQRALLTSRAARAVLQAADCIGVYWSNGMIVNSSTLFLEMTEDLSVEALPLYLWIRFQPMAGEDDTVNLYTVGLEQFGIMEIEVENCTQEPAQLLEFAFDVAHYMVLEDCIISDGDTIGSTDEQRFLVRHLPSIVEPDRIAHRIELP